MPGTLRDALLKDLNNFFDDELNSKKTYCRYLFGVAMGIAANNQDTYTGVYAANMDRESVREEISNMIHKGANYLRTDDLLDRASDEFMSYYVSSKSKEESSETLSDAVLKMLDYYKEEESKKNKPEISYNQVVNIVNFLVDDFLNSNVFQAFSSKNGTRKFMNDNNISLLNKRQRFLMLASEAGLQMDESVTEDEIRREFTNKIANKYFNIKDDIGSDFNLSTKEKIATAINNLSLNNNQKQWLKESLESGDLSFLENLAEKGAIDKSLIDDYKLELSAVSPNNFGAK